MSVEIDKFLFRCFKTKPYAHQLKALQLSYDKENFAYFMEMGCGKSKVLIDNIAWLYWHKKIDTAIIVAPKGVYTNWRNNEIPTHLTDDISAKVYTWKSNLNKRETTELKNSVGHEARSHLRILLINVEAFATKKIFKFLDTFTHRSNFLVAVDESTTIKNIKAKRTKALIQFAEKAKYKRILTGAPITKSPLDLYSQFLFMDRKILGFCSYWSFQGRYAVIMNRKMGSHQFNQVVGYKNLDELKKKIDPHSFRVTKKDALDLPPKTYVTRQVDLTMEQERHYQSIKKTSVAFLESGDMVTAPEVMTRLVDIL